MLNNEEVEAETLQCPRCESTDTKFCYFNNYTLSQPRHFCKSCRRYWTAGGTIRSVPVVASFQSMAPNSTRSASSDRGSDSTVLGSTESNMGNSFRNILLSLNQIEEGWGVNSGHPSFSGSKHHQPMNSTHDGIDAGDGGKNIVEGDNEWGRPSTNGGYPGGGTSSTHPGPNVDKIQPNIGVVEETPPHVAIDMGALEEAPPNRRREAAARVLSDATTQIIVQAAGAGLSSSIAGSHVVKHCVFASTLVGLGLTFAGIGMHTKTPKWASFLTKAGATVSASAVVVGLATQLPLALALPTGIVAAMGICCIWLK